LAKRFPVDKPEEFESMHGIAPYLNFTKVEPRPMRKSNEEEPTISSGFTEFATVGRGVEYYTDFQSPTVCSVSPRMLEPANEKSVYWFCVPTYA